MGSLYGCRLRGGHRGERTAAIFFRVAVKPPSNDDDLLFGRWPMGGEGAFFLKKSIFGLELGAVVLSIYHFRATLRSKSSAIYIDNDAAVAAIINGDASSTSEF